MLLFRKMKSKKESETAAWLICAVWAYQSGLGVKNFHLFYYFMRWCPLSSCFFKRFFSSNPFRFGCSLYCFFIADPRRQPVCITLPNTV